MDANELRTGVVYGRTTKSPPRLENADPVIVLDLAWRYEWTPGATFDSPILLRRMPNDTKSGGRRRHTQIGLLAAQLAHPTVDVGDVCAAAEPVLSGLAVEPGDAVELPSAAQLLTDPSGAGLATLCVVHPAYLRAEYDYLVTKAAQEAAEQRHRAEQAAKALVLSQRAHEAGISVVIVDRWDGPEIQVGVDEFTVLLDAYVQQRSDSGLEATGCLIEPKSDLRPTTT